MKQDIIDAVTGWVQQTMGWPDAHISQISGGMTNTLWSAGPDEHGPPACVIRMVNTELSEAGLIERAAERAITASASAACPRAVPPILTPTEGIALPGRTIYVRAEKWVRGDDVSRESLATPLACQAVGTIFAAVHATTPALPVPEQAWAIRIARRCYAALAAIPEAAAVFPAWAGVRWAAVIDRLEAAIPADAWLAQLVPCHNDAQEGNWLRAAPGDLRLIDWEYAGWNWRGFDLANFMVEWELSYEVEVQPGFVVSPQPQPAARAARNALLCAYCAGCGVPFNELDAQWDLLHIMTDASHAAWSLWAIFMAVHKNAPPEGTVFDYGEYARTRAKLISAEIMGEDGAGL